MRGDGKRGGLVGDVRLRQLVGREGWGGVTGQG